jgi:hypothetical protein
LTPFLLLNVERTLPHLRAAVAFHLARLVAGLLESAVPPNWHGRADYLPRNPPRQLLGIRAMNFISCSLVS